jgi:hypothetical protein
MYDQPEWFMNKVKLELNKVAKKRTIRRDLLQALQ